MFVNLQDAVVFEASLGNIGGVADVAYKNRVSSALEKSERASSVCVHMGE